MTRYKEIIAGIREKDSALAEYWEEGIDIIIHKLKFLSPEAIPSVCIIDQGHDLQVINSPDLQEKVKIAGGTLATDVNDHVAIFIIIQRDESLYGAIPSFLKSHSDIKAVRDNKIYIIQTSLFDISDRNYLQDIEILAEIIQPKYFVFGRDGEDWIKFELG